MTLTPNEWDVIKRMGEGWSLALREDGFYLVRSGKRRRLVGSELVGRLLFLGVVDAGAGVGLLVFTLRGRQLGNCRP